MRLRARLVQLAAAPGSALVARLLLCIVLCGAAEPRRRVDVQVVEVTAGRAYLSPAGEALVKIGDPVQIGRGQYQVLATNHRTLVVAVGKRPMARGERGFVMVSAKPAATFRTRAVPQPLEAFAHQWRPPRLPADTQSPRPVPLGTMSDTHRNRAALLLDYTRIEPLSGPALAIGRMRLRALLHGELTHVPLSFDADGFVEFWQAQDLATRPGNASRPFLTVRQLELGYRGETLQGAVGRLRYASDNVGMLDGARIATRVSDAWTLGAFGGVLPEPLDASVSTEASQFGANVAWQDEADTARPRVNLMVQGSRYRGQTDEKRITGAFESYPEFGRLGARAEVSFFDADNPWAASPAELTAAGADASVKLGSLRLGAALDMRRPARSLWLAAFLPPGYFCVARPTAGSAASEPCVGGDQRYAAMLNAAWEASAWTLDAGTTFTASRPADAEQATAFLSLRQRDVLGALRLDTGVSAMRGSLIEGAALDVGVGAPFADDTADVSMSYRPSLTRYRLASDTFLEHGLASRFWWAPAPTLDLTASIELVRGPDVDVLLLQLAAAWRPRF